MQDHHTPQPPAGRPPSGPSHTGVPGPGHMIEPDVHLLDRLHVVFKHRRLILSVLLLVVVATLLKTYTTTPMYRAQARLLIEDERSTAIPGFSQAYIDYWADTAPYYQTQYRMLASRGLAQRVVRAVQIEHVAEFNETAPRSINVDALVQPVREWAGAAARAVLPAAEEEEIGIEPPPPGESPAESAYISAFLSRLEVLPVRDTRLVDLTYVAADPEFAARAINSLAEEYVQQNLEHRMAATQKSLEWLTGELDKQRLKVEAGERALAEYRESQDALSLGERQNIVISRLNQLNDAVTAARTRRVQRETAYNQVSALVAQGAPLDSFPAVQQSPGVQELKGRLAELERELTLLSERYGERHPEIIRVNASIENATRQLDQEVARAVRTIESEYRQAVEEERQLNVSLDEQKRASMDLDQKSVSYSVLERETNTDREVYQALLQREAELRVISNSRANNVQLLDRAQVPGAPFQPNPRRDFLMALVIGLALGVGLAFGIDYLDDTIKTPEDITRKLGLPLLGLVPAVRGDRVPVLSGPVPHDFGEAFRALRTSLVFTSGAGATRVVLVTSAQPLEGKTTTACNIAIALSVGGARVLLIDADMRRPGLHRTLGINNGIGLSHLLTGQARVREAIQRMPESNLLVITAGRLPPNPSELLASERMKQLVANLSTGPFDWVIIDSPPVLAVTDAVILAPLVTGVTFVLGSEMTRYRLAERAVEMLMASQPHVLGAVLNRVDFDRNKYYYSRYYGYQYKSYYGQAAASA